MNSLRFIPFILSLLMLWGLSNAAYSMNSVNALLVSYNVSASLQSSLSATNMTYGSANFVALYEPNSKLDFVLNVSSSPYKVLLNATQVFQIIKPYTLKSSFAAANFTSFNSQLSAYQASTSRTLNDCLSVTGLNRGATCTQANYCQSCQLVPSCNKVLYNTNGPQGVFGVGVASFAVTYAQLNNSFNKLYSIFSSINASTQANSIGNINSYFNNVSTISGTIYQNPIFPPTANITSTQFGQCSNYLGSGQKTLAQNASAPGAPWYCNSIGYCANLNYNYTLLHLMQVRLSVISALPMLDSQIQSIAASAVSTSTSYVLPQVTKQQSAKLGAILNTTLSGYPALINGTQSLLGHIANATVSSRLAALKSAYINLTSNYVSLNLTLASVAVVAQMNALQAASAKLNATYFGMVSRSNNATALLIKAQLNAKSYPASLGSSSYTQLVDNSNLNGQISNTMLLSSQINASLKASQSVYASSLPLISFTEISRATLAPFATAIAPLLSTGYSAAVALVPALGALLALIVGIIVLILLFAFRHSLKHKNKLLENRRTANAWNRLFVIAGVLILVYIAGSYFYAASANVSAPAASFSSAVTGSKSVAIAINGTATAGETLCQSKLAQAVTAMKKKPILISISSGACVTNSTTKALGSCMGSYAQSATPIIILTATQSPSINLYSMYGTVLSVQGPDQFLATCYPTLLLK